MKYELFFASDDQWFDKVRSALPHEQQPRDWKPPDYVALMWAERDEILNLISEAFAGVSREGGVSIHETWVRDCRGTPEECRLARLQDVDQCREDVPEEDLQEFQSALSFYDEIGLRYYLPAYMAWDLRRFEGLEGGTRSMLEYYLEQVDPRHPCRFGILNAFQSHTVYRFVRFLAEYSCYAHEMTAAIQNYWGQFQIRP